MLFEASGSGLQSFASLAKTTEYQFGLQESKIGFATFTINETKPLFPLLDGTGSSALSSTQADSKEHPETEANIFFDPVVSLPSDFDSRSGEENEDCMFMHKAKLYRYDGEVKMWKDRGIGSIKILRHTKEE